MKVKCVSNKDLENITVGKEYTVINIIDEFPKKYLIKNNSDDICWYPSDCFIKQQSSPFNWKRYFIATIVCIIFISLLSLLRNNFKSDLESFGFMKGWFSCILFVIIFYYEKLTKTK